MKGKYSPLAVAVAALVALGGCSSAIRVEWRTSLLAPINRETRQDPETADVERRIVEGLIKEAGGQDELARAYLQSKGYSAEEVERRLAIVKAGPR